MAPGSSAGPETVSPSPDRPATVGNNASKFQLSRSARSSNPVLRRCNSERTFGIARGRSNSDLRERLRTRLEATAMPRETAPRFDPGVGGPCSPAGYGPILVPRGAGRRTRVFIEPVYAQEGAGFACGSRFTRPPASTAKSSLCLSERRQVRRKPGGVAWGARRGLVGMEGYGSERETPAFRATPGTLSAPGRDRP